jgi:hypothetical protein
LGAEPPGEGVAEDQAEGDVAAPKVRAYRPERSVWSEGEASPFLIWGDEKIADFDLFFLFFFIFFLTAFIN